MKWATQGDIIALDQNLFQLYWNGCLVSGWNIWFEVEDYFLLLLFFVVCGGGVVVVGGGGGGGGLNTQIMIIR